MFARFCDDDTQNITGVRRLTRHAMFALEMADNLGQVYNFNGSNQALAAGKCMLASAGPLS